MRIVQACWNGIAAAKAEAANMSSRLESRFKKDLDEAKARWVANESARRRGQHHAALRRLSILPVDLAIFWLAGIALFWGAAAIIRVDAPHLLADIPSGEAFGMSLTEPGRGGLAGILILGTLFLVYQRVRAVAKSAARLDGTEKDCPYPSTDCVPRFWADLARFAPGHQGRITEGSEGESILKLRLRNSLGDDYYGVANPLVASSQDIDLLLIGPTGIWALESKYHKGVVTYANGQFTKTKTYYGRGGVRQTKTEVFDIDREMTREVEAIRLALKTRFSGMPDLQQSVKGVVVFTHPMVKLRTDGASFPCVEIQNLAALIRAAEAVPSLTDDVAVQILDMLLERSKKFAKSPEDEKKASARDYFIANLSDLEPRIAQAIEEAADMGDPVVEAKPAFPLWRLVSTFGLVLAVFFAHRAATMPLPEPFAPLAQRNGNTAVASAQPLKRPSGSARSRTATTAASKSDKDSSLQARPEAASTPTDGKETTIPGIPSGGPANWRSLD